MKGFRAALLEKAGLEKDIFYEGGEMLAQISQRGGGCSIPGNIQSQVRQGSEQPGLVKMSLLFFCKCPFPPKYFIIKIKKEEGKWLAEGNF